MICIGVNAEKTFALNAKISINHKTKKKIKMKKRKKMKMKMKMKTMMMMKMMKKSMFQLSFQKKILSVLAAIPLRIIIIFAKHVTKIYAMDVMIIIPPTILLSIFQK